MALLSRPFVSQPLHILAVGLVGLLPYGALTLWCAHVSRKDALTPNAAPVDRDHHLAARCPGGMVGGDILA
jgi:hypothetical protein